MSVAAVGRSQDQSIGVRAAAVLTSPWLAPAILVLAVAQQCLGHQNADNSWLFTVDERVLDGARPYVDVLETNPPASFLLYMPATLLARALGARVEFVAPAMVFAGACGSIWLAGRVLRAAGLLDRSETAFLLSAAIFALLETSGTSFGEREHIAALALLPVLATQAARMAGASPSAGAALAAGLLAGVAVCVKPHFALAVGLPLAGALVARRSLRPAFGVENFAAGAVVAAYGLSLWIFFAAYFNLLPELVDAYLPVTLGWAALVAKPWVGLYAALLATAAMIGGRACLGPRTFPPLAASVGFFVAYLWQGKGWSNHGLPFVQLACLALASVAAPFVADASRRASIGSPRLIGLWLALPVAIYAPLIYGAMGQWSMGEETPGLAEAVLRHAPAHPRVIAMSPNLTPGFPLTRRIEGVWAGRTQQLWLLSAARALIAAGRGDEAYRARLASYANKDAANFLADVRANHPDVIIVDSDPRIAKAIADMPDLAAALQDYAPAETVDDMTVWARRPASGAAQPGD